MSNLNVKPDPKSIGNDQPDPDHREAERWSYEPARKAKRDRLIAIAAQNISGLARTIEPRGQVEEVLDRVSIGRGGPIELFKIQGDPRGAGFISQVPPRFHELRHRYGFHFDNRQDQEKSWWWIMLDDAGTGPKMTPVEVAEPKTGKPKAEPRQPQLITPTVGIQPGLFGEPPKQTPQSWRDPEMREAR